MVLCKKIIKHRLNIINMNELYCKDYQKMRIDKLNKQFLGKCINSILITKINRIITSSQIRTNPQLLDGSTHFDICFEVEGIIYMLNEIIPDIQIIDINKKTIIGNSKYANVSIPLIPELNIFKTGDLTPVIARKIQYNIYSNKISISANIFLPIPKTEIPIYIPKGNLQNNSSLNDLFKILDELINSLDKLSKEDKTIKDFFIKLVYPYKNVLSYKNIKFTDNENNNIILNCNSEILSSKNNLDKLKNKAFFLPDSYLNNISIYTVDYDKLTKSNIWTYEKNINFIILELDFTEIIKVFLTEFIKKHNELLSLISTYTPIKKLNNSNHIWKLYNSYKK
jgi:hypothetical protein